MADNADNGSSNAVNAMSVSTPAGVSGCTIPAGDKLFEQYHAREWGYPPREDARWYEKVCLEGFQAGLSWRTVLHKRQAFRLAFDQFDPHQVADYTEVDVRRLLGNPGIVRNRRKIESTINNARRALSLQAESGSLAAFFHTFHPPAAERPARVTAAWLAANPVTPTSTRLARALKQRGWSFVGPTGMYALMQATGIVNDHLHDCPARAGAERARSA